MNSAPHLLIEDRPEFERLLNEVLRTANDRQDLAAIGERLNSEQLRTMALNAASAISACAHAEYQHFVDVRDRMREPQPSAVRTKEADGPDGGEEPGGPVGLATAMGQAAEGSGAGLVAILAVLVPVLAGAAAVIFLLVGYVLRMIEPAPSIAQPMVTAGWLFAVLTAAGILIAGFALLLTALRNGSSAIRGSAREERLREVDEAREVWREALLERGILPFLREALTDPSGRGPAGPATGGPGSAGPTADGSASDAKARGTSGYDPARHQTAGRTPHLGYSRPGFSTEEEGPRTRPRYSSPDFTSPDYGGPEHQPE